MINAVSVKVFLEFAKPVAPPPITIFGHFIPVVRGKTPVLPRHRKIIGRCAGLHIGVEQLRLHPGIHTAGTYSYWNITFECNSFAAGVFMNFYQLFVQMILQKIKQGNFRILWITFISKSHYLIGIVGTEFTPFPKFGCFILIPEVRKNRIRHQPGFIGFEKLTVIIRSKYSRTFFRIY